MQERQKEIMVQREELPFSGKSLFTKIFHKGQLIAVEGIDANVILYLKKGYVKLFKNQRQGISSVLQIKGPGEFLNLINLYEENCHYSIESITDVVVDIYRVKDLKQESSSKPLFSQMIIKILTQDILEVQNIASILSLVCARDRVIEIYKLLAKKFGTPCTNCLVVPFKASRGTISSMIGICPETLIRELSLLKQQSFILESKNSLTVFTRSSVSSPLLTKKLL